jgi:ligand-binding sensor domain-containing protein
VRRAVWLAGGLAVCTVTAALMRPVEGWQRDLERVQRLPTLAWVRPERSSASQGNTRLRPLTAALTTLEAHALPTDSPVIGIARAGDQTLVATFDDGLCQMDGERCTPLPVGQQVNDMVAAPGGDFFVATADGAFRIDAGGRVEPLAEGAFSAVAIWRGQPWFVSPRGLSTIDAQGFLTYGADHGLTAEQPAALAACGDSLCIGAQDGLWLFDGKRARRAEGVEPQFVTAVTSALGKLWFGTFDSGLAEITHGHARTLGADTLPDARIEPRALAQAGMLALAGTPSGLLVIDGDRAALVSDGLGAREITAVRSSASGIWIGYRGGFRRVQVVVP